MRPIVLVAVGLIACGGSTRARPLGVSENLDEARRHDAEAARHEDSAAEAAASQRQHELVCGDTVLADQASSGGERLSPRRPCWSAEEDVVARHLHEAQRLRADASAHRARARELAAAEDRSCAKMPADELTHTPFAHWEDIAAVTAELDGDRVRGARIRFREVEGLTAGWLRTAIACHRARAAALGNDPTYMGYDPTVLAGVDVEVVDDASGVVVIVIGRDDADALAAYGRAEDLLGGW